MLTKQKVINRFWQLRARASKSFIIAIEPNTRHFCKHLCQRPVLCKENFVYIDSLPPFKEIKLGTSDNDPSRKLQPKKNGLYPVIKLYSHTLTVEINGIHNVVSVDRVALAKQKEKRASQKGLYLQLNQKEAEKQDEACHSLKSRAAARANTRSESWSVTVNKKTQPTTECDDMGSRQWAYSTTLRDGISTPHTAHTEVTRLSRHM